MHGESTRRFSDLRPTLSEQPPRVMFALRPLTAIAVGGLFIVALAWATAATWFIFSNDDVTAQLLRRQAGLQAAYEEKVGALRARLDRVASQKLLEQDSLEDRLSQLVSRQVELETRQAMLFNLGKLGARATSTPSALWMSSPRTFMPTAPSISVIAESSSVMRQSSPKRSASAEVTCSVRPSKRSGANPIRR